MSARRRFVIKLGNDYSIGRGEQRSPDPEHAFVFVDGESSVYPDARAWARAHRDHYHVGGEILRRFEAYCSEHEDCLEDPRLAWACAMATQAEANALTGK